MILKKSSHPAPPKQQDALKTTGERLMTTVSGESVTEHLHRYAIAMQYCGGREVLDIACGEGYGSALLQQTAARVTGVDLDPAAVAHAARKYGRANLDFRQGSCEGIPMADASVDVVVSFETIEHHDKHAEMIHEIRRVLRPGGLLIISTPDRVNYTEKPGYHNPFHVKELDLAEFHNLLKQSFRNVALAFQRITHGSLVVPHDDAPAVLKVLHGSFQGISPMRIDPIYFLALASDQPLPPIAASFFDGEDILRRQFEAILSSTSYRLGHALLQPVRWISTALCKDK